MSVNRSSDLQTALSSGTLIRWMTDDRWEILFWPEGACKSSKYSTQEAFAFQVGTKKYLLLQVMLQNE